MSKETDTLPAEQHALPVGAHAAEVAFAQMISVVPEGTSDGWGIIAPVLGAATFEDLNVIVSKLPDAESQIGREQKIETLTRHVSTIADGPPFYLVIQATDLKTGEALAWQTSSQTIMAQLVTAHVRGWLPLIAEVVKATVATKGGFYPLSLNVLGSGQ